MTPCQKGYPCVYQSQDCDKCMLPRCVMKHVTIEEKDGEYAYDSLTRTVSPWTVTTKPRHRDTDPLDQWYEEWAFRQMAAEIRSADTYERVHGRVRQKRIATKV